MREAAEAMRLTAQDLEKLGVADRIIREPPLGGAHRDPTAAIDAVGEAIANMLAEMDNKSPKKLIRDRRKKFLDIGGKGACRLICEIRTPLYFSFSPKCIARRSGVGRYGYAAQMKGQTNPGWAVRITHQLGQQHLETLGHIRAHRQPQPRFIACLEGGDNHTMIRRQRLAL